MSTPTILGTRRALMFMPTRPCKYGHLAPRYMCGGNSCVECSIIRAKRWRETHRERVRQSSEKYRLANTAKCNERTIRSMAAKPEYYREAARLRYARNPHSDNARVQRRLALIAGAPGRSISGPEWSEKVASHGGRCAYCARVTTLEMDHIDPLSRGGAHDIENVTPACRSCNPSKGDDTLLMWLASGRFSRRNAEMQ